MNKTKKKDKSFWGKHRISIISALSFVIIAWLLNLFILIGLDKNDRGTFGDMFGGVNALFSGLAFAGLIYAILLQHAELKATREELAGQREEQKKQNKFIAQQTFENTFFQMLRVLNDIVSDMDLITSTTSYKEKSIIKGCDCFRTFKNDFYENNTANLLYSTMREEGQAERLLEINKRYLDFFNKRQQDLGHYYRILYNLIKFIDNSSIDDKRLYTNIVRAQLSDAEVFLLFYNCLSKNGSEKFKPLVEKYALLKVINRDSDLNILYIDLYDKRAFGETL